MTSSTARSAAVLTLVLTLLCAAGGLLYYRAQLFANVNWDRGVFIEDETRLDSSIFNIARDRGLIGSRNGAAGELFLDGPDCEGQILSDDALKPAASAQELRDHRTTLRLLCGSPQGEEIRHEIEAWNAVYDLLAVRDNRYQDDGCQSKRGDLKAHVFVPRDCKPNLWKAERIFADSRVAASWIPGAEPPPDDFSKIADEKSAYAGDWAMLKSAEADPGNKPLYRLHSEKIDVPPNKEVMIDLVGRLRGVRVYGAGLAEPEIAKVRTHTVDPAKPETSDAGIAIGPARVAIYILCGEESAFEARLRRSRAQQEPLTLPAAARRGAKPDQYDDDETGDEEECEAEPAAASRIPISYQIVLKGQTGRGARLQELIVELDAESVQILPAELRRDYSENAPDSRANIRLTRHIRARCPPSFRNMPGACELSWERVPGARRALPPPQFDVVADGAPGTALVDKQSGFITSQAFDEGFGSIIGLGPQDWGSLMFSLAHRSSAPSAAPAAPVELTIDRRLQALTRDVIEARVKGNCGETSKKQRGRRPKNGCRPLGGNQTATLVVLDAEKSPGDIKAISTWPRLPKNLHMWDLEALESDGMGTAGAAWRLVAPDQRPGSTFKAVTAMAAIDAAIHPSIAPALRDKLSPLLKGQLSQTEQKSLLRLSSATWSPGVRKGTKKCVIDANGPLNAIAVPNEQNPQWCAHNFWGQRGVSAYWQAVAPTTCPRASSSGNAPQFGMCEALMVSSNLFFGGVAERLTRSAVHAESDPLALEKMARQLSFNHQPCRDAAGNVISKDGSPLPCGFNLLRSTELHPQKLRASPIRLDLRTYQDAAADLQTVLRTGWGDGADATPLAMASIYASLGRRLLVRPTLRQISRRPDGCPTEPEQNECEPLLSDWNSASPLFESLRMGLHAVSGPSGSARGAFVGADALRLMPDGKPRLFVKTGTATYRAVNDDTGKVATYFTLWLAGWIEGVEGTPINNRLAFACVVTRGTGNDTGGGICAPLVRQFLETLNRKAQK
ncbi:hypothetical protein ACQR06_26025 [Bradyrhizobium sp. HKCCYLRH1065]|uniref:hypothetical protein n=1 Tax=Bradyrhizobium sp. HKCCYLRH1065 TaxID=3420753 RepID=UPI003EBEE26D